VQARRLLTLVTALAVVTGTAFAATGIWMRARADVTTAGQPRHEPTGPGAARSASPSPTPSRTLPPDAAIPARAGGEFTAASGQGAVIGTAGKRIRYRVEVEKGIAWGGLAPWTPNSFAATIGQVLAAPRGWTWSAQHPVTNAEVHLRNASWSFQRTDTATYDVRIRLATPTTVDKICGQAGLDTDGVHSCRVGKTILINLRRWLQGAPGYPVTIDEYRTGVINHEVGHFLGFAHMTCAGPGQLAPVMGRQTTELGGCKPNVYPFDEHGVFIAGPWEES
jgi:hypothetical protein